VSDLDVRAALDLLVQALQRIRAVQDKSGPYMLSVDAGAEKQEELVGVAARCTR
jgi:hypothetical protein